MLTPRIRIECVKSCGGGSGALKNEDEAAGPEELRRPEGEEVGSVYAGSEGAGAEDEGTMFLGESPDEEELKVGLAEDGSIGLGGFSMVRVRARVSLPFGHSEVCSFCFCFFLGG